MQCFIQFSLRCSEIGMGETERVTRGWGAPGGAGTEQGAGPDMHQKEGEGNL